MNSPHASRQTGSTLITTLVMLIVLTLMVISAIRSSSTNLRIAGNMQMQEEAVTAAQQATEMILNSDFTAAPAASSVIVSNGPLQQNITVSVSAPVCTGSRPLVTTDPDFTDTCTMGAKPLNPNIVFAAASGTPMAQPTLCLKQQWEIGATITDPISGSSTVMHQGVSVNVPLNVACPN